MSHGGYRQRAAEAAKALEAAHRDERIAAAMTEEERDWMLILSEHLYAVYQKRVVLAAASDG